MAAESILTYKKPNYPKTTKGKNGVQTVIHYIGPHSTLSAAEPARNAEWGDYQGYVTRTYLEPEMDNTDTSLLIVDMESTFDATASPEAAGTVQEITYEVEWTMFQRSIFEHPSFAPNTGGEYQLTDDDIVAVQFWEAGENHEYKKDFKYLPSEDDKTPVTLSTNARKCAEVILKGIDTYEDYAPVLRRTTKYADGNPATTDAGKRDIAGPVFAGKPTGYEYRKTADRSVRTDRDRQWNQVEEWIGAKKVLIDRDQIYI
ncbi:MAG TPA: hypothetical protein V6D20_18400 [Candidatus Obscuribacterales bacterium]